MAFGSDTFGGASGAVSELFAAQGARSRASGNRAEAAGYDLAKKYAFQNEEFTKQSTEIKMLQSERDIYRGVGATEAGIAGAGLKESGSALDLLASGHQQGALTQQVIGQQGLITEAGYHQQGESYLLMSNAASEAAAAQDNAASAHDVMAAVRGATGIASLFTGGGAAAAGPILAGNEAVLAGFGSD